MQGGQGLPQVAPPVQGDLPPAGGHRDRRRRGQGLSCCVFTVDALTWCVFTCDAHKSALRSATLTCILSRPLQCTCAARQRHWGASAEQITSHPRSQLLSGGAVQVHEAAHHFTKKFFGKHPKNTGTPCSTDLVRRCWSLRRSLTSAHCLVTRSPAGRHLPHQPRRQVLGGVRPQRGHPGKHLRRLGGGGVSLTSVFLPCYSFDRLA